jgi:hypothetical protein
MTLSLQDRVALYHHAFPKRPPMWVFNDRIEGIWRGGNDYRGSGFHGSYPPCFLPRVHALFPDKKLVLHVPSGSLPPGDYTRIDGNPDLNPDFCGDIHDLLSLVGDRRFDLACVDVPYAKVDADHYGFPMVQRQIVFRSVLSVLEVGGHMVWLDMIHPNYRKADSAQDGTIYFRQEFPDEAPQVGEVGIFGSTNHRVRGVFIFEKLREKENKQR